MKDLPTSQAASPEDALDAGRRASSAGRRAARRELAVALGDVARLPLRLFDYWAERPVREQRMREDLRALAPRPEPPPARSLEPLRGAGRAPTILLSCAEASGEIHASNLARSLRTRCAELDLPEPRLIGLGGSGLREAGVELAVNTVDRATMGIGGALRALPYYVDLVGRVHDVLASSDVDLFLPVDSPALHVPLGRIARRLGVPTVHFVTPQYWGWAPWRVERYATAVDLALSILPFEPAWFERHGVHSAHVGHPLVDALGGTPSTRPAPDATDLVLLPGSRRGVIERNLPWMLKVVAEVEPRLGGAEVLVLQQDERHRERIESILAQEGSSARLLVGDLHGHLARARTALSVSGTILVDLLHHRLPTVVLYRLSGALEAWMSRNLLTVPYFASPNLLAGEEVLPEFCFPGEGPREEVAEALVRCHGDGDWRRGCIQGLERAARRLGPPGAVERAADHALEALARRMQP